MSDQEEARGAGDDYERAESDMSPAEPSGSRDRGKNGNGEALSDAAVLDAIRDAVLSEDTAAARRRRPLRTRPEPEEAVATPDAPETAEAVDVAIESTADEALTEEPSADASAGDEGGRDETDSVETDSVGNEPSDHEFAAKSGAENESDEDADLEIEDRDVEDGNDENREAEPGTAAGVTEEATDLDGDIDGPDHGTPAEADVSADAAAATAVETETETDADPDEFPAADVAESASETPALRDGLDMARVVEAILFASAEPVTEKDLASRLPDGADVRVLLAELAEIYAPRGVNLVQVAGKWAFRTASDLGFLLQKERVEPKKLSRAALETLAIIAYHQPVTRAEIEDLRGVSVSKGTLDVLLDVGWVRMRGRKPVPGRPITYGTSDAFLEHFGLGTVTDLPGLEELKAAGLLDWRLPPDFGVPAPKRDGDGEGDGEIDDDDGDEEEALAEEEDFDEDVDAEEDGETDDGEAVAEDDIDETDDTAELSDEDDPETEKAAEDGLEPDDTDLAHEADPEDDPERNDR